MIDQETLLSALRTVKDPELNVNVIDLGLVYSIQSHDDHVDVEMTLTSPACPAGPEILQGAVKALEADPGNRQGECPARDVSSLVSRQDERRRARPVRLFLALMPDTIDRLRIPTGRDVCSSTAMTIEFLATAERRSEPSISTDCRGLIQFRRLPVN